mgnify:CR=1 FL=1
MNHTSFIADKEKMRDFKILTKQEFLNFYSYLTEATQRTLLLWICLGQDQTSNNFFCKSFEERRRSQVCFLQWRLRHLESF